MMRSSAHLPIQKSFKLKQRCMSSIMECDEQCEVSTYLYKGECRGAITKPRDTDLAGLKMSKVTNIIDGHLERWSRGTKQGQSRGCTTNVLDFTNYSCHLPNSFQADY